MEMIIPIMLFYVFSGIMVLSAFLVIALKNPVHSVLFLILALFNAAGLFVLLGAELLGMLLVIIYVGAVAVLFLFVVMMLNINVAKAKKSFQSYLPLGMLIAAVLFIELSMILTSSYTGLELKAPVPSEITNTEALGLVIYTDYAYLFQLSGLILLVAMIGSIVLTHRKREGVRKQVIGDQIARRKEETVTLVKVETGSGI